MANLAIAALILIALLMPSPSSAQSDIALLTTCAFSKGDPIAKVKRFYGLASEPQTLRSVTPGGTAFQYHLEEYGVWVFFDDRLRVGSLRFDPPFRGKIEGVAIGDDADRVRLAKGQPARQFPGMPDPVANQRRQERVREILDALPDPTPKARVIEVFAEISRLTGAPPEFMTAWVYNPGKPSFVRYDVSSRDSKVQSILVNSCSPET
jgi:hypothetical protein